MGIKVLGPHVNESGMYFAVNKQGEIRFGLGAIKGTGDAAVESIIAEREATGPYEDLFDFAKRLNQRAVNKKTFEALALSGAFDCFVNMHRRQYVYSRDNDSSLIEKAIKFAAKTQQEENSSQASLFGGSTGVTMPKPKIENVEPFSELEKLNLEKEVVGIYISGHPLDNFKLELTSFCNTICSQLNEIELLLDKDVRVGGIVTSVEHRTTKTGKPFGKFVLEDFSGNSGKDTFTLFGETYMKFRNFMNNGLFLLIEGNVMKSSWGQERIEYKIRNIELLDEIAAKRIQGISLRIPLQNVTREMINTLEKNCEKYSGPAALKVFLKDEDEDIQVELISRLARIKISNVFIAELKKLGEVGVFTDSTAVRWLTDELPVQAQETSNIGTISDTFVLEEVES